MTEDVCASCIVSAAGPVVSRSWSLRLLLTTCPALFASRVSSTRHAGEEFNEIIRRHEILRTTFEVHNGEPAQVIASGLVLPLLPLDLQRVGRS